MSTSFANQISAMTGIAIGVSTEITQDEISYFLKEGLRDVVNNVSKTKPHDLHLFGGSTDVSNSSGLEVKSGKVLNVWRADGTSATNLNQCMQINASLKHRAADEESLHYRSTKNPAYYWENEFVYILPAPSDSGVNKGVVSYVQYDSLVHNATNPEFLSEEYWPLVSLYAAIKQLEAYRAFYITTEEDVELAAGLDTNIALLKAKYDGAFITQAPQGAQQ